MVWARVFGNIKKRPCTRWIIKYEAEVGCAVERQFHIFPGHLLGSNLRISGIWSVFLSAGIAIWKSQWMKSMFNGKSEAFCFTHDCDSTERGDAQFRCPMRPAPVTPLPAAPPGEEQHPLPGPAHSAGPPLTDTPPLTQTQRHRQRHTRTSRPQRVHHFPRAAAACPARSLASPSPPWPAARRRSRAGALNPSPAFQPDRKSVV